MNKSKYVDIASVIQVLGNVYNNPSLLDNVKYTFIEDDFPEEFHRVLFGTIYNLYTGGAKEITLNAIEDYLIQRPPAYAIYKSSKGAEYLQSLKEVVQLSTFDYYYSRMKKFTLLRMYNEKCGMDLAWLYDIDNILDAKKKQAQEDWLDSTSLEEIAELIDKKIVDIRLNYVDNFEDESTNAGEGAVDLLQRLREKPEIGYPLYGDLFNTITRGARLKKFYLRSAATGVGKTRSMIADACSIACDEIYDEIEKCWVKNGTKEPTIFISTEQEKDEIQTMMIAFLSNVDEEHIINSKYTEGEWDRVVYAAKLLTKCPLYIQQLPDFSLQDIENTIKRGIYDHNIKYVFFDYIHSSMKILSEISSKAGVKGLREDNILFMVSIRLKDLCNQYGVFIMTATQLNADYRTAQQYDQNLLRGAKSIADKIDCGMIMLEASVEDLKALESLTKLRGFEVPNIKVSVYKNRRGRYKDVLVWCKGERGVCKIKPLFVTSYQYELIDIDITRIEVS